MPCSVNRLQTVPSLPVDEDEACRDEIYVVLTWQSQWTGVLSSGLCWMQQECTPSTERSHSYCQPTQTRQLYITGHTLSLLHRWKRVTCLLLTTRDHVCTRLYSVRTWLRFTEFGVLCAGVFRQSWPFARRNHATLCCANVARH